MDAALRRDMPQFIVKGAGGDRTCDRACGGIMVVTSLGRPIGALVHIVAKKNIDEQMFAIYNEFMGKQNT